MTFCPKGMNPSIIRGIEKPGKFDAKRRMNLPHVFCFFFLLVHFRERQPGDIPILTSYLCQKAS